MEAKEKGVRNPIGQPSCVLSVKKKKRISLIDSIGNSGAFLVIVPKGINQLGSDERKRLYRISGENLEVERAQ